MYKGTTNNKQLTLARQSRSCAVPAAVKGGDDHPPILRVFLSSLFGSLISLASGILLVTVTSLIAIFMPDPLSFIMPLALLSLLLASFSGGFAATKMMGGSAIVCGFMTAALWCALSLLLSLCLYNAPSSSYALWKALLLHGASALFSILGAFAGNYKPKRDPRKKRRFGRS